MINVNEIYNHNKNNCSPKKERKKIIKRPQHHNRMEYQPRKMMNRIEKRAIAITFKLRITSNFHLILFVFHAQQILA